LPHQLALAEAEDKLEALEEERKLCYVMFSRAKKGLFVSYCKNSKYRDNRGFLRFKPSSPSQFLFEAGLLDKKIS